MFALTLVLGVLAAEPDSPAKTFYKPDLFQTLIEPDCSHCIDESKRVGRALRDDDRVLAWIRGPYEGGAIPYRWFLVLHRVISDTYGVFVYDPDADFVRGWPASLDFRFHGWRNGILVMRHTDGTLYDSLTGEAFDGPRRGEHLEPIPTLETDWGPWLVLQPDTVAFEMKPTYRPMAVPERTSEESLRTRPEPDGRLDPDQRVFGLTVNGQSVAWPLSRFGEGRELLDVEVGGQQAVLFWDGTTGTAVAYVPETESAGDDAPRILTLELDEAGDPQAPWVDRETGSGWSIAGRAVSGPLEGETLRWLPGVMVKWYAWSASYPETELVRE